MIEFTDFIVKAVALLYTIISHELAHGWVALANGDTTARDEGRLSWNPKDHLDPLGTVSLIFFHIGWAKPVPINVQNFRRPRLGLLTTSLAGVGMNFLSALISLTCLAYLPIRQSSALYDFLWYVAGYGVSFFLFNLIPIPPLDGSRVIMTFLPDRWAEKLDQLGESYGSLVIFLFVVSGAYEKVAGPVFSAVWSFLFGLFI